MSPFKPDQTKKTFSSGTFSIYSNPYHTGTPTLLSLLCECVSSTNRIRPIVQVSVQCFTSLVLRHTKGFVALSPEPIVSQSLVSVWSRSVRFCPCRWRLGMLDFFFSLLIVSSIFSFPTKKKPGGLMYVLAHTHTGTNLLCFILWWNQFSIPS